VKRLGLAYRHFGEPVPLPKRLGGRFFPKNSPFQRRVEKVGLVSLTASAVITAVGGYLEHLLPGGNVLAWTIHLELDISIVTLLFAMIFKFLPDARLSWRDVRLGAALTTALFLVGKYALGLYLGSGAAGSAYGAAGSLITMLIWIYYAAQIVLFGAEFTRVYAQERGRGIRPAKHAVRVDRKEIELPPLTDRGDK